MPRNKVADNSAAQRHQHRPTLDPDSQNVLGQLAEVSEVLGFLARRQKYDMMGDPRLGQAVPQRREIVSSDDIVRYDDGVATPHEREHLAAGALDQLRSHQDVVASIAELDAQPL